MRPAMKYLLSLPPHLARHFHALEGKDPTTWFSASDPPEAKLGSGGGTAHLLAEAWQHFAPDQPLERWLGHTRSLLIHAGGQSRRLPAYAPSGKILTPIPVFRWARGQRLQQNLLDLQLPLLETIMAAAPDSYRCLVASGDVLVRATGALPSLPEVDVLCMGIWMRPEQVRHHGVYFMHRRQPDTLAFSLQKPSLDQLRSLARDYLFMIDVGIWLLSEKALRVLFQASGWEAAAQRFAGGQPAYYDLYSDFGQGLGTDPVVADPALAGLTSAVVPLPEGEFYHFGRSRELIDSALALQNRTQDQRRIYHRYIKPSPDIFVLNAHTGLAWSAAHRQIWIENSHIPATWTLTHSHVLTGVPTNDWTLHLPPGVCLDFVPLGPDRWCIRPYGFEDAFRGAVDDPATEWLGQPVRDWLAARGLPLSLLPAGQDIQEAALFPVVRTAELSAGWVQWLIDPEPAAMPVFQALWQRERLSANALSEQARLDLLYAQRRARREAALPLLAGNHAQSIFFQLDLAALAQDYARTDHPLPAPPDPVTTDPLLRVHDRMFRAMVTRHRDQPGWERYDAEAFAILRETLTAQVQPVQARRQVLDDQIVWSRCPVRLDLAGGWTDTPPYCLLYGGRVVNLAVELNGQPPIQVYAKPLDRPEIVIRSIDLSYEERLTTFAELGNYAELGSAFAIPKAALALAGLLPPFAAQPETSLARQLQAAGGGIELSLLAAVPKGSGLGTSSILAATVLGTLSSFFDLGWDLMEIGHRTLILEQLLTSGGGWQDQYGGILPGIKYLETGPGLMQQPVVRWLPDQFFRHPDQQACMLLYYTGITRVAHHILGEIVRGMFLNSQQHLSHIHALYHHAAQTYETIQGGNYAQLADKVRRTWTLNQALDSGTNPPAVAAILDQVGDWLAGAKLLGAGGGGFLLMMAKDAEAARRIRQALETRPPNALARFVDFAVSSQGLQTTRS